MRNLGPAQRKRVPGRAGDRVAPRRPWTVRRRPGGAIHDGLIDFGAGAMPCKLGNSGIAAGKREGDGATPAGRYGILGGHVRRDRLPLNVLYRGLKAIGPRDGWCDDPDSGAYNRPVRLPFRAGHEKMARADRLYDVCLVLDWNIFPRARRRGSAIFMHLTRPDGGGTQGCVALDPATMRRLLGRLRPGTVLRVLP